MTPRLAKRIVLLLVSFFLLPFYSEDSLSANSRHQELAEYYAPVIFQETKSDWLDYIGRFDFDGDWNGSNNWQNAYLYELEAYVYYAVIESTHHYFITYAFFHPRDYTSEPMEGFAPKMEHENDMEGLTLLVQKDWSRMGKLLLMETLAHDHFFIYVNQDAGQMVLESEKVDGPIVFLEEGRRVRHRRPAVFIEAQGHGVISADSEVRRKEFEFPGVIYRYSGRGAEVPSYSRDQDVSYRLLSIEETLWPKRFQVADDETYCCGDQYQMADGGLVSMGESFNGPIGGCAARPPWGWDQQNDGPIEKGDWFRDPLRSYKVQGVRALTGRYLHNPYLESRQPDRTVSLCSEGGSSRTVKESVTETVIGIAEVLLSGGVRKGRLGQQAKDLFVTDTTLLEWQGRAGWEEWKWNLEIASELQPQIIEEVADSFLKLPSSQLSAFSSPAFNAPARYFHNVVIRYRSSLDDASVRISWLYRDMEEFDDYHSRVFPLQRSGRWVMERFDLSTSSYWRDSERVVRLRVESILDGDGFGFFGFGEGEEKSELEPIEIEFIVFDRRAFADSFVR